MSTQENYIRAVRQELKRHAVWEPGAPIEAGDYGELVNGCFKKLGHIREFGVEHIDIAPSSPAFWEFASKDVSSKLANATVSAGLPLEDPAGEASLHIQLGGKHSLFIRAHNTQLKDIQNLQEIAESINFDLGWNPNWKVVSSVRMARSFVLLLGSESGSAVSVSGKANLVQAFQAATISTDAGLNINGSAALKLIGKTGPLSLDLIQIKRGLMSMKAKVKFAGPMGGIGPSWELVPATDELL